MELESYCDGVAFELTGWKAKMYDVVRKLDRASTGDKTKVVPQVNDLHMIIEELDDRIGKLRTECPTEWAPAKEEMEKKFFHLKKNWEGVWENVSPGEIGG
jgi:hypothetical protein